MSQAGILNRGVYPPGSVVQTLEGNSGGKVGPDGTNNINVVGDGTTIDVVGNPGTNTLTVSTTGAVADFFSTDSGSAVPVLGILNVLGGNNIITSGAGNTVTIDLNGTTNHAVQVGNASGSLTSIPVGLTGQVLTGVTGGDPVFAAPPASGVTSITGNTGAAQTGAISLITANSTPIFAGSAGTITLDFALTDNLLLGADPVGIVGHNNSCYGFFAGSSLVSSTNSTYIGAFAGFQQTTSNDSTGVGANALSGEIAGSAANTALGSGSLQSVQDGLFNIGIGYTAGSNYFTNESLNIAIGNQGVTGDLSAIRIGTNGSQTSCFVAGIDGVNVGSVATVVTEAGTQLGTAVITAGTGITVTPGANTITIASSGTATLTVTPVNNAASPYTVLTTDSFLAVNTSGGVVTIRLPDAPSTGRVFYVKDSNGTAAASNITVTTVGGAVNIDGATSFVMNTAYESINVIFDGTAYEVF